MLGKKRRNSGLKVGRKGKGLGGFKWRNYGTQKFSLSKKLRK